MKKETKVISILASAIFTISLLIMFFPKGSAETSFEDRDNEFSDFYWQNTAMMIGFGSTNTLIGFEYLEGENELDEEMFYFLKDSYNKFKYLDNLGSVSESGTHVNNIYDINNTEINTRIEINYELYSILNDAKRLFEISEGIFDVTVGLMFEEIDNYIKEETHTYDVVQYATGFNQVFEDRLLLEEVDSKYYATRTNNQTNLNLGGYLKGYFTEYVRSINNKHFDTSREIFISSGGSSMSYIGEAEKIMYVASPRDEDRCPNEIGYDDCPGKWVGQNNWHIATSGDYNQYRMDGGLRVHHLVDPRDGTFVQDRGLVSILTNDYASYFDALSSILFIADPSEYTTILGQLDQEIDVVYLTTNIAQTDFTVDYIQATAEEKFEIGTRYLPREVS